MDISIVIVTYNSAKYLDRCLTSIEKAMNHLIKEVIVVDNCSVDNSVAIAEKYSSFVKIIRNERNVGYSGGNNIGFENALGRYLLFLNPDTAIFENSLQTLLDFAESKKEYGIFGPKLVFPDGSLQRYFCKFYTLRSIMFRRSFFGKLFSKSIDHPLLGDVEKSNYLELDWILGSALLIKRDIFESVGKFDENYKLYFEDVDLCYRIRKAGLKAGYCCTSVIIHDHQRESAKGFSKKTIWHIQSAIRFFMKHGWKL